MANNFKEILHKIKTSDKKIKVFIALGLIGILLIFMSEIIPSTTQSTKKDEYSYDEYITTLESETTKLLESIDGAGECRVMITLENTRESVFAKNYEESSSGSYYSNSNEYVLYKGQEGETPLLVKEYFPQIKGVAVVCSGADSVAVKESIINCLTSVFDLPSTKISVSKLRNKVK